jgi:hypothetical protein
MERTKKDIDAIRDRKTAVTLADRMSPDAELVAFTAFVEKSTLNDTKALAYYYRVHFKDYINELLDENIKAQTSTHIKEARKMYIPPKTEKRGRKSGSKLFPSN